MASVSTPSANEPTNNLIISPHSTAITNDKSTNLKKNGISSGISDVAFASVLSEKTDLKKLMMMMKKIIIIIKNSKKRQFLAGTRN